MMNIINQIRTAFAKRNEYNRTVYEISHLSREMALDLGIFREDAQKIAHSHVYG